MIIQGAITNIYRTWPTLVLSVCTILASGVSWAQYNGHNMRGDFGMFSGTQPAPGFYAGLLAVNYDVDTVQDRNGDSIGAGEGGLDVRAIAPYFWWVNDYKVLGGNYSLFVSPSWTDNSLEAPSLGVSSDTEVGAGDLYIQPINLGWSGNRADYMAGLGVFAPTGRYSDGASDNTGLGMWSWEIFGGATVYLNDARSWSFSAMAFYETHSSKEDSDVTVGDILTFEGGLGKSWAEGAAAFGLSYFAQWKLTEDEQGGLKNPNKHEIFGIGPELVLPLASKQKYYGTLSFRYLFDFNVKSNTEGDTALLMATFVVPPLVY